MNEPHSQPQHETSSGGGWVFALLLLMPVLYVLSIGPMALLADKGVLPREPVREFYKPVVWLHDHTPLARPLEWYGEVWGWH